MLLDEKVLSQEGKGILGEIRHYCSNLRILCMAISLNNDRCLEIVRHGIHGVFEKDRTGHLIPRAVRKVCSGEIWLSRSLISRIVDHSSRLPSHESILSSASVSYSA